MADAKRRKRQAVADLRSVATAVGMTPSRALPDMSAADFTEFHREVSAQCSTPEQRVQAVGALSMFHGRPVEDAAQALPAVPSLPDDMWIKENCFVVVLDGPSWVEDTA